jgi:hypothetical protein
MGIYPKRHLNDCVFIHFGLHERAVGPEVSIEELVGPECEL